MRTPAFRLDGKRALVLGASSGLGRASAVALGEYGAEVTAAARRGDALEETVGMIGEVGGKGIAATLDVTDIKKCGDWIAANGPFDILVNSAGAIRPAPATETTEADYDMVTGINVKSAYFATRAVAKGLIAAGKPGSLINISSQMGHIGGDGRAVYSATKHAVEGMTKSMAIEWGQHGIRVNTICPTFIVTELTKVTLEDPAKLEWVKSNIKLGRIGAPEDIMGAVVYLASDASSLVTGSALMVDGGWTAA